MFQAQNYLFNKMDFDGLVELNYVAVEDLSDTISLFTSGQLCAVSVQYLMRYDISM